MPIIGASSVDPSSVDHQAVIDTNPNFTSTIIPERADQPIDNMANLVSTMRHNVFHGLGEDPNVHINHFNTMA